MDNRVSCIVPCYNSEEYISNTISSLLHQTVRPAEIIIINDGSTDNTLEVIRGIEEQNKGIVKVLDLGVNKGVSSARNYGVENSVGEHILFVDSDDIAEPRLIERYQRRLGELNGAGEDEYVLCYSAYIQIDENDVEVSQIIQGIQVEPEEVLGYQFYRNYILSASGVLVKRNAFIESGGFNEDFSYSEDWDLWLRLARLGGFAYVDEPLVRIRRHAANTSAKVESMLDGEKAVLCQYAVEYIREAIFRRRLSIEANTVDYVSILFRLGYWKNGFLELKRLLDKGHQSYRLYFHLGLYYLKQKNLSKALDCFEQTISLKPDHGAALNNAGALYLVKGDRKTARYHLRTAIQHYPFYMDANINYSFLSGKNVTPAQLQFTWRELRPVLTIYPLELINRDEGPKEGGTGI